eukprot:TRINITY_DN24265_c0_g1_i1.p1 TRINITY_DN24265_c0_g1~~TRINITY_DN24265_c0_g1_i1.p1  ORF type:complete len:269 (-),score=44.75 TRINITY_DN24265_c0_g1_i1:80-859(-)
MTQEKHEEWRAKFGLQLALRGDLPAVIAADECYQDKKTNVPYVRYLGRPPAGHLCYFRYYGFRVSLAANLTQIFQGDAKKKIEEIDALGACISKHDTKFVQYKDDRALALLNDSKEILDTPDLTPCAAEWAAVEANIIPFESDIVPMTLAIRNTLWHDLNRRVPPSAYYNCSKFFWDYIGTNDTSEQRQRRGDWIDCLVPHTAQTEWREVTRCVAESLEPGIECEDKAIKLFDKWLSENEKMYTKTEETFHNLTRRTRG